MPFNKISHYQLFPRCYAINLYSLSHCFEVQKEKNAFSLYTAGNELLKVLYDFESYMSTGRLSHTTAPGYFRYNLLCIYPNLPLVVDFVDQSVAGSLLSWLPCFLWLRNKSWDSNKLFFVLPSISSTTNSFFPCIAYGCYTVVLAL